MEPLLTMGELAELFKISRSTAYRLAKEHGWPHHKFGIEIRFSAEDIQAIKDMTAKKQTTERRAPNVGIRAQKRNQK